MVPDRLDYLSEKWKQKRPDIDIRPWQVWGRVTRLHELFLAAIAPVLTKHELNFKEYQTLGALVLAGEPYEASPNQIGQFNLLTSGGVANLLSRMEREGLVRRRPDPTDGRSVIVTATERGLKHFNAVLIEENGLEHELLGRLTTEECAMLAMLLRKLLLSMEAAS